MRRMTISRFRGAGTLIAAALLAAAAPLSAQDTTAVVQQRQVHMVRDGETLWTLAELYFGDPFLWPEIYRINAPVLEDPHWIFPGEELRLVPPDTPRLVADPNQQLQVGDSVLIPVADSVPQADFLQLPIVGDPELQNQVTEAPPAAQDTTAVVRHRRVHVVREGETLWTLAEFYLGDPFMWPEIYRINTLVVEDPHWIYPGEELSLVPPDTVRLVADPNQQLQVGDSVLIPVADSVPQADSLQLPIVDDPELQNQVTEAQPPPPPPARAQRTVLRKRGEETRRGLTVVRNPPPRPPARLRFYSAGFLTEREEFPWAEVLGAVGQSTLPTLRATSSATVYERVSLHAPENATYHVGDSLILSRLSRQIPDWGRIVVPTAIARVMAVSGREVEARIEMQFERVADGQVALPVEPFRDRGGVEPVPIENGMRGSVIAVRNLHPLAGLLEVVFIDRGRGDGLVPGDVFEVIVEDEGSVFPARRVATLRVVHVRQRSASVMIMSLQGADIRPGAIVRLIRKMP